MSTNTPSKNTFRRTRRVILAVTILMISCFVAYNLYASRMIETVEQTSTQTQSDEQPMATDDAPQTVIEQIATFSGLNGYSVSGGLRIESNGLERQLVFADDFASSVGPDVLVYLTKNDTVTQGGAVVDPISLGAIQSFNGAQTYTLPDNFDEYTSVVIWCRAFSSAFGAASIQ